MIVGIRALRAEAQGAVALFCFAAFLPVIADFFVGICWYARLWRACVDPDLFLNSTPEACVPGLRAHVSLSLAWRPADPLSQPGSS